MAMGSLSGIIQRPLVAAAAVAVASASTDISDKFSFPNLRLNYSSPEQSKSSDPSLPESKSSWVSHISVSRLSNFSFMNKIRVPIPNINYSGCNAGSSASSNLFYNSVTSAPILLNSYQSADLPKAGKPTALSRHVPLPPSDLSYRWHLPPSDLSYRWHLPEANAYDTTRCSSAKSKTVVVLLGWLGAKQKHLKTYAEWYTSRGFHVITFTFPMNEVLSYKVGGKAEQQVELLVNHLADWLEEEDRKNLVFHTFSNTGWLTYGAILERFQKQEASLVDRIKGCIVDSAPVAAPDPQVWASGFSAAFLKKQSVATKGTPGLIKSGMSELVVEAKPAATEAALLVVLEKFFEVILNLPAVNRRLSDVVTVLSSRQPTCPQLYIYSSADRVIPAGSVESFIEEQRKAGHEVRSCNFKSTPHVDHYRNDPQLYTSQLTHFLEDCVLEDCKQSP